MFQNLTFLNVLGCNDFEKLTTDEFEMKLHWNKKSQSLFNMDGLMILLSL